MAGIPVGLGIDLLGLDLMGLDLADLDPIGLNRWLGPIGSRPGLPHKLLPLFPGLRWAFPVHAFHPLPFLAYIFAPFAIRRVHAASRYYGGRNFSGND